MVQLVGILNITPDSFSDGGLFTDPKLAIKHANQMFADGASLIDIGAESTRPGSKKLRPDEEWQRLEPILHPLLERYPNQLSIDTYHPETAEKVLSMAPCLINDVTGLGDDKMLDVIVKYHATYIVCHLPAKDVQIAHSGILLDDIHEVVASLMTKYEVLRAAGLSSDQIILDPGIGFGKTPELNYKLLRFAELVPKHKVMIGYSRKRFLGENRMELAANLEAGRIAIAAGAAYIRVHDVAGHRQLLY